MRAEHARRALRRDRVGAVLVIVAPGQGAQTPGFLTPWLENPLRRPARLALRGRRHRPRPLRHRGRRRDHPRHRGRPAAAGRLRACSPPSSCSRTRPTRSTRSARSPATASASSTAAAGARAITAEQAMVLVRERGNAMARPPRSPPTEHDRRPRRRPRRGAGQARAARPHPRQRQRPRPDRRGRHRRAARGARRRPAGQGPAGAAVGRRRLPHRAHGARRRACSAGLARSVSTHDPRIAADLQPRRPGRRTTAARCSSGSSRQISQPGPLGPLHGDDARPRRHRHARDAAGRHPDRHRQAGDKGVETFALKTPDQLDDARAFVDKHGERVAPRHQPDLADARRAGQGHLPPDRRPARGQLDRPRAPGSAPCQTGRTRPRAPRRTAARSSSGSSRTATWSPPASR